MARDVLTVETVDRSGLDPTLNVPVVANGVEIVNNGKFIVRINNGGGGASTWSADIKSAVDGVDPASKTLVVPAGESRYWGPFPVSFYGAELWLDLDVDTSVTLEILRF